MYHCLYNYTVARLVSRQRDTSLEVSRSLKKPSSKLVNDITFGVSVVLESFGNASLIPSAAPQASMSIPQGSKTTEIPRLGHLLILIVYSLNHTQRHT